MSKKPNNKPTKPDTRKKSYDIGDSQKKIEELRKAMEIPPKTKEADDKN